MAEPSSPHRPTAGALYATPHAGPPALTQQCMLCSLRQWNPRNGECVMHVQVSLPASLGVRALEHARCALRNCELWNGQGYPFHEGPLTCMDIHPSGTSALTGSEDTTARLTNLATGKVRRRPHASCPSRTAEGVAIVRCWAR